MYPCMYDQKENKSYLHMNNGKMRKTHESKHKYNKATIKEKVDRIT